MIARHRGCTHCYCRNPLRRRRIELLWQFGSHTLACFLAEVLARGGYRARDLKALDEALEAFTRFDRTTITEAGLDQWPPIVRLVEDEERAP